MEFAEKIRALAGKIEKLRGGILTEEACKTAFVMPFISALGYDVFDPEVVVPELIADVGIKKGEKIDYAIKVAGKIAILIECKGCGANLGTAHMSQLYRYFTVTDARFGILTNGIDYWFYSDLDQPNRMNHAPFLRFRMLEYRPHQIEELKKFASESFDVDSILSTANELKFRSAIQAELAKEFESPSAQMIELLVGRVFEGKMTKRVKDEFAPIVISAFRDSIRDLVSDRLSTALDSTNERGARPMPIPTLTEANPEEPADPDVVTTEEEIEAFHIIKAIVRSVVRSDRVYMRDAKAYCAILLDNNNRRPIARLHFNAKAAKYIGLFTGKVEERIKVDSLDEIYAHADKLRACAASYDIL